MTEINVGVEEGQYDETVDPFSAEHAPGVQLIVQMRIYDVLMGIYTELTKDEPEKAQALLDAHEAGLIITPPPRYTLPE